MCQNTPDDYSREICYSFHIFGFTYILKEKYAGIAIVNVFWKNLDEECMARKIPMETKIRVPINKNLE